MTTEALWLATDQLTKPTRKHLTRNDRIGLTDDPEHFETETAAELLHQLANDPARTVCHVADYRRAVRRLGAQNSRSAVVPPLWDQAVAAVDGVGDTDGGGAVPKRERSIADLALMDTLYGIREFVTDQLKRAGIAPRTKVTDQIRQLSSAAVTSLDDQLIVWWTAKVEHWVRTLTAQLNAVEGPKPFRLRAACPACGVRQIRVREQDEWRLVAPIRVDFRNGQLRAATCENVDCNATWFRGEAINALADTLNAQGVADVTGVSA